MKCLLLASLTLSFLSAAPRVARAESGANNGGGTSNSSAGNGDAKSGGSQPKSDSSPNASNGQQKQKSPNSLLPWT